jgi:hypothetical protein
MPWALGYIPVMRLARAGEQRGQTVYARGKLIPCAAKASKRGIYGERIAA